MSFMVRLLLFFIAAASVADCFQPPSDLHSDTYAIYSLLFTNPPTSHGPDNNPIYLIADTTVDGTPPEPCVTPPPERRAKFAEVMADFNARSNEHTKLSRDLNISKPYRLVSSAPSATAREAADLFSVGNVYFDRDRTIALTYLSSVCGSLCGMFKWRVFERNKDGKWEPRDWVGCFTLAAK